MDISFLFALAAIWTPFGVAAFWIGRKAPLTIAIRWFCIGELAAIPILALVAWGSTAGLLEFLQISAGASFYLSCFWIPVVFGAFTIGRGRFSLLSVLLFGAIEVVAIAMFIAAMQITDL